ncbi:aminotransferase class I/II-fold pyridoxal phosphate-dependent enzyme [Sporosarcina sp. Te-1]|uniref:aminotransferase class I/II-fold pyridoxal phosphate-dependent enzyme n=1 Tax=Sporosarcina sp. Te-1 TaxID=2818390 RepID=UPI001A9D9DA9|nr:aminotransferase class I/II-fold pyridoxal phosphate-dependent enzyme [Sporosarcina sp. Te-1]QTD42923.1 aminotransferase class I/II-fold pyridoxal phosphate-dependent enzyme [Sporosarcina sp. Te-1]
MTQLSQHNAPIAEALTKYKAMRVVPFDVPGHKRGRGNEELAAFLGEQCLSVDVNSMKPLDNLIHPVSVIREAEQLAAEAFGSKHAFFMVNGTTSAVQAMVMTACKAGEKIILPRNVHRSAINALILSGAIPVYVNPGVQQELGIPLGMALDDVRRTMEENPDAKAILINNPTYYGICSNLQAITDLAHEHGMLVLVDEAHGTHFYFNEELPASAMSVGADMAAVSMHKSGGSLTQSSFLLINNDVSEGYTRQIINLTQTTSGSYLLLSSLDISRKNLALHGKEIFDKVIGMAQYTREEINQIGGYYAYSKELLNGDTIFDFDITKLSVHTREIGLEGIEIYDILRDEYDIQIEFGDIGNLLAYISVGDRHRDIERLVAALGEIKRRYGKESGQMFQHEYINPIVELTPQQAFYAKKRNMPLAESAGNISSEFVMSYPPGIPILAPGERITDEVLSYIEYCREKGCFLSGTEDSQVKRINVVKESER